MENNTIGNYKSIDLARRVSIEPIRSEDSRTCSDLLKTPMDMLIGELSRISQPCRKLWLSVSLLYGCWVSGRWKHIQLLLIRLTSNWLCMERMSRAVKAGWKDSTRELQWLHRTFGIRSSEVHCRLIRLRSILLGDRILGRSCNLRTRIMLVFDHELQYH